MSIDIECPNHIRRRERTSLGVSRRTQLRSLTWTIGTDLEDGGRWRKVRTSRIIAGIRISQVQTSHEAWGKSALMEEGTFETGKGSSRCWSPSNPGLAEIRSPKVMKTLNPQL